MADIVPADKFSRLPERYQRRAREIAARVADIDALLKPAAPAEIGDELKRMRGQLSPQPETDPREIAEGYRDACADIPGWAVSEAGRDYRCGRVENHSGQFIPHAAEFAKRAREIIRPFLAERWALRTEASKLVERADDEARRIAIQIERSDPAVKARVAELAAKAMAGHPKHIAGPRRVLTPEKQARLDTMKKVRPEVSKIGETRIGKANERPA